MAGAAGRKKEEQVFDFGDPRTVWLNVTNAILGLVILVSLGLVAKAMIDEIRRRKTRKVLSLDDHAYPVEGLGLTMADGGEQIRAAEKK
ncbi:MAG TPA: hypothetical protein PLP42_08100 [Acidobacteriota bacterium]|nr:hypothetical protein [Acidobacteriota bacterium]